MEWVIGYLCVGLLLAALANLAAKDMNRLTFGVILLFWIIAYPIGFYKALKEALKDEES